jgi:hypothetical protein
MGGEKKMDKRFLNLISIKMYITNVVTYLILYVQLTLTVLTKVF